MEIADLITAEQILCGVTVSSKKKLLETLSDLLSKTNAGLAELEIFNGLVSREKLGSTGLGHGVAIPHGRFKNLSETVAVFVKLNEAVDFDAIDGEPVDLIFALMVPGESTEEHLQLLAALAEMFADAEIRNKLRQAISASEIEVIIKRWCPGIQEVASLG